MARLSRQAMQTDRYPNVRRQAARVYLLACKLESMDRQEAEAASPIDLGSAGRESGFGVSGVAASAEDVRTDVVVQGEVNSPQNGVKMRQDKMETL